MILSFWGLKIGAFDSYHILAGSAPGFKTLSASLLNRQAVQNGKILLG